MAHRLKDGEADGPGVAAATSRRKATRSSSLRQAATAARVACLAGTQLPAPGANGGRAELQTATVEIPYMPWSEVQRLLPMGLQQVEHRRLNPTSRDEAYAAFLQALTSWGALSDLPLDTGGVLRVNLPFCGGFTEAVVLLPFLSNGFLMRHAGGREGGVAGARSVAVCGCDLEPQSLWWPTLREWAARTLGERVRLDLWQQDLQAAPLAPPAGLVLAVHPRATLFGPWYDILANVLRSIQPGGNCVIATFFRCEALAVELILRRYAIRVDIRENPFYVGLPKDAEQTPLRFAVIIDKETLHDAKPQLV